MMIKNSGRCLLPNRLGEAFLPLRWFHWITQNWQNWQTDEIITKLPPNRQQCCKRGCKVKARHGLPRRAWAMQPPSCSTAKTGELKVLQFPQMHWFLNWFKIIAVTIEINIKLQREAPSLMWVISPHIRNICISGHWSGTAPAGMLAYPSQTWFLSQSLQWSIFLAIIVNHLNQISKAIKPSPQAVHNISSWIKSLGKWYEWKRGPRK